jgi:2-dehydropantoate 2-reductase
MNILVYGAGAIGSVYAAKLQEAGNNVALLARGSKAVSLRTYGIQLEDATTGRRTTTPFLWSNSSLPPITMMSSS